MTPVRSTLLQHPLVVLFVLGLGIRLILMPLFTFNGDTMYWMMAITLGDNDFGLYGALGYFYTPVWGLILSLVNAACTMLGITDYGTLIGEAVQYEDGFCVLSAVVTSPAFNFMTKVPIVIADMISAWLVYRIVMKATDGDEHKSIIACGLWLLCPLLMVESAIHSMFDSIGVMMLLLTVYAVMRNQYWLAGAAYSVSVLTKFFPIFFIFFFIAYVLRKEGINAGGFRQLYKSIIGAIVMFVLVELPAVYEGQAWRSLFFLTSRLGIADGTLDVMVDPIRILMVVVAVIALIALLVLVNRKYGFMSVRAVCEMDPAVRDRRFYKSMAVLTALLVLFVLVRAAMSVDLSGDASHIFEVIGMKLVTLATVCSIILEMIVGYRLLFCREFNNSSLFSALMLSGLFIFLWPPAPSYILIMLPFVMLYAVVCDRRFLKMFMLISVFMTLAEIPSLLTSLSSVAVYFGWLSVETAFLNVLELLTTYVMGFPVQGLMLAIFDVPAFIFMIMTIIRWYQYNSKEGSVCA